MNEELIIDSLLQVDSFDKAASLLSKKWYPRYNRLKRKPEKDLFMATSVTVTSIGIGTSTGWPTPIRIELVVLGFKIIIVPKGTTVRTSGGDTIVTWNEFNLKGAVDYIYEYSGRKN